MPPKNRKSRVTFAQNECRRSTLSRGRNSVYSTHSRRLSVEEEGVLYTVRIAERRKTPKVTKWQSGRQAMMMSTRNLVSRLAVHGNTGNTKDQNERIDQTGTDTSALSSEGLESFDLDDLESDSDDDSVDSEYEPNSPGTRGGKTGKHKRRSAGQEQLARSLLGELVITESTQNLLYEIEKDGFDNSCDGAEKEGACTRSVVQRQYTISKIKKKHYGGLAYPIAVVARLLGLEMGKELRRVEGYAYEPAKLLYSYITWTFSSSFLSVFFSFLIIFLMLSIVFGLLLMTAGKHRPECIVISGEEFGTNPDTMFYDAFSLSWTTFTTVGYGNTFTATGTDFDSTHHSKCSWVVFLCTLEAFTGLLYAGMCAALLFGKVNRVQCHANVTFCNAVCLLYEPQKEDRVFSYRSDSDEDDMYAIEEDEIMLPRLSLLSQNSSKKEINASCPVLKFQVVNEYCNRESGDIVDAIMKIVGVKMTTSNGKVTHSQYVRVNLVDSEHPFFSRVWHSVHVLDETSQLLTHKARIKIKENGGVWPKHWFKSPDKIRNKLDFDSLIVTLSGTSNLSACTVHAYKRYSAGDLLVGFDFAPIVYFNPEMDSLEVDKSLIHDVKEQSMGKGEDVKKNKRSSTCTIESFL